jgi:hypothetical protein
VYKVAHHCLRRNICSMALTVLSMQPNLAKSCCKQYTIRLHAPSFVPSKEQKRVASKLQRYLAGKSVLGDFSRPHPDSRICCANCLPDGGAPTAATNST